MARKAQRKLVVPFGLDARLIRSRYAAMLPAHKQAFVAEFDRFSQLQQLRLDAAARSARAAGVGPTAAEQRNIVVAKRTVATLKRLRPDLPPRGLPDVPGPVLLGPPYNKAVPVDFSSNGAVDFKAWDGGPNSATGQAGGAVTTWSGGIGMAKSQVGLFIHVPQAPASAGGLPTYEVVIQATLRGAYYIEAPRYGYAAVSADLVMDFVDLVPTPQFIQPHSVNLVSATAFSPFAEVTAWDYLNNTNLAIAPPPPLTPNINSFQQTFLVNMGDTPGPAQINVGVTQNVSASVGAIASIDIEMTVLSIGFALVS